MKVVLLYSSILFFCCILLSCGTAEKENITSNEVITNSFSEVEKLTQQLSNYNFETPSETFIIDEKLSEISSLAYNAEEHTFITNNDEDGFFYILDPQSFEIKSEEKFAKKGDYESIEKIGNDIIICKSNGNLYFYNKTSSETKTYKTALATENDVEGLCYDKKTNSLLLACKGQPMNTKHKKKNEKSIYQFDLEKKELITEPFISILDSELESYVEFKFINESKSTIKELKNKVEDFAPSGIAIHPKTGEYFLISAKASLLIILDTNTKLKAVIFLNEKTNPQPEGICFDKDNNLYISTEGQGFNAKVFKFSSQ